MVRAQRRIFHYIYKITRFDGMYYIGMHSTDNLEDGYFGSGKRLWYSINKHGKDKHSKEILEYFETREGLVSREKELVCKELLEDSQCLNLKLGGTGGWNLPPDRQAIGRLAGAAAGGKARQLKMTWEERSAQVKKSWGKYPDKFYKNSLIGIAAMSSPSANLKRKSTLSKINHQQGEKNSQFGSCWVIKNESPIKIQKEFLEEYLIKGYRRGRK